MFIDDLDRCEDIHAIVKTLEALKLLVKSKAFVAVVVVAIDTMQYATLALENHYSGILRRGTCIHPSGLYYLEKIIQLPYCVVPLTIQDNDMLSCSCYYDSLFADDNNEQEHSAKVTTSNHHLIGNEKQRCWWNDHNNE